MPGCEPAGTTPHSPAPTGEVIDLNAARRGTHLDRQEAPVAGLHGDPTPDTPELQLTVLIQSLFKARGRTLTDPATAEAYDIALTAARTIIDGALAQGLIAEIGHRALVGMLENARQVPGLL